MASKFDLEAVAIMRAVLEEATRELNASQATKAKMPESIVRKAAEGAVSREEPKGSAIEAGTRPAV